MTERTDFSEFLTDRDRILMAAWTLPNEGPLTDAQRKQALENFRVYIERVGLATDDVGRQIGSPRKTAIDDLLKGVVRANDDQHIRRLNDWVEQHARQQAVRLRGHFVQTKVATDIHAVARMVRENQTMGIVYGPTGIGKTRCAQALHDTLVGSILLTITNSCYRPAGLTSLLVATVGARDISTIRGRLRFTNHFERLVDRLKDSSRLIMVDEGHKLHDSALELLRELHDLTGCPILLFATKELRDRIRRKANPDAGQIRSRFDIEFALTQGSDATRGDRRKLFSVDDIRKLYAQVPIRLSQDATHYLQDVANNFGEGSLRRCRILLTNAARRARKRQKLEDDATVTVTADDLAYVEEVFRPDPDEKQQTRERRQRAVAATA